jgi:hypothetical protein
MRVVLDSNAVDPLIDLPGAAEVVREAIERGELEVLYTHVNVDEVAKTGDLDRRQRPLLTLAEFGKLVPTGGFVLGVSRLDHGRLMDEADVPAFTALTSGNAEKHSRDALIASTARLEGCVLVTNETRLTARARDGGIEVLSSAELLARLGYQGDGES